MTPNAAHIEAIFMAALEKETAQERLAFIEQACAGNPEALPRLRALLQAHEETRGPLDAPVLGPAAAIDLPSGGEGPGSVIGPYKLLQQLGEGGFGVVYLAEQSAPVR